LKNKKLIPEKQREANKKKEEFQISVTNSAAKNNIKIKGTRNTMEDSSLAILKK
jgi:hypothetical protein